MIGRNPLPAAVLAAFLAACAASSALTPSDDDTVLSGHVLDVPDPGLTGAYEVETLIYGTGSDHRRAVFRDSVDIVTEPVDASDLVDLGEDADERNRYWRFAPDAFPINGRVWRPVGEGPFPLVLIVHGNHNMREFSDPGYGYLGRLLASRGFILVSVDMNFLNGRIREENDARGWMLLKHLEAWREFVSAEGPLRGAADLDRVALIGHSRGGEAVGHAAAFNRLSRYPDDGSVTFDFGFGIRSIVAIAPVDGQYMPTGRHVPVHDVNYLVFHGSHDGDVTSFHGLRQYARATFDPASDRFKAAVYMYRANHGQWNTVWNNKDRGPRSGRQLRLADLLPPDQQRRFAEVYISAFLEATLRDDPRYLPLFRDHRVAGDWLPETMYITRYQHASFRPLAAFEEDIDLTSGSVPGVVIHADSMAGWAEETIVLRSRNRASTSNSQQSQAVRLSWEADSTGHRPPPEYRVTLDARAASLLRVREASAIELLLGVEDAPADSLASPGAVLDLSVVVVDSAGTEASLALSRYGPIRKPLEIRVGRRSFDQEWFGNTWELILQGFTIPMGDFVASSPELHAGSIREVGLRFDRTPSGTVVLDDLGLSNPPSAFLEARLQTSR